MTAYRTYGPAAAARSPRRAAAGRAAHVAREFARALRRAFGPTTVGVARNGAAAGASAGTTAPVFHPPGVIRVVTPAELDAAGAATTADGEACS